MGRFRCISEFAISKEELFAFHESPEGFQQLVAALPGVQVIQAPQSLQVGEIAILRVPILPGIRVQWVAEHIDYKKNEFFVDIQKQGPFRKFCHRHIFHKGSQENTSILEDAIEYETYFEPFSRMVVVQILKNQFLLRHKTIASCLNISYQNQECGPLL